MSVVESNTTGYRLYMLEKRELTELPDNLEERSRISEVSGNLAQSQ